MDRAPLLEWWKLILIVIMLTWATWMTQASVTPIELGKEVKTVKWTISTTKSTLTTSKNYSKIHKGSSLSSELVLETVEWHLTTSTSVLQTTSLEVEVHSILIKTSQIWSIECRMKPTYMMLTQATYFKSKWTVPDAVDLGPRMEPHRFRRTSKVAIHLEVLSTIWITNMLLRAHPQTRASK